MHLDMKKVPDKDEVQITIYAEPIKILSIEGDYVWCQWENRKWKMRVPNWVIPFDRQNDAFANAFLSYLNGLLTQPKTYKEEQVPDQELRIFIAEKILNWTLYDSPSGEGKMWYNADGVGLPYILEGYWNPMEVLGQAWYLLEKKFTYPDWEWAITNKSGGYLVRIYNQKGNWEIDEEDVSVSTAICLAAIRAKASEEE